MPLDDNIFCISRSVSYTHLDVYKRQGLGKTHAALAIAGEVLEKGFDVIYVSSPDFFSMLEALRFGSDLAGEEEMLLRTAAGADLLILDDLGSEFNSGFLISTLYSCLLYTSRCV